MVTAAVTAMFSTTLTVMDGYPRAIDRAIKVIKTDDPDQTANADISEPYWIALIGIGVLMTLFLHFFVSSLTQMIDFITIVSFMAGPILGYLNLKAVTSPHVPKEHQPGKAMLAFSYFGLVSMVCCGRHLPHEPSGLRKIRKPCANTRRRRLSMPRREFFAVGGTSIAAAALGAPDPLSATDKVQTIEQQEREIVALTFDVFGTVVDWRTSVIREGEMLSLEKGFDIDWGEFADRWRGGYGPSMNRVRTGELPWTKIDVLHRMVLDELIVEYRLTGLSEDETDRFNRVWHRLMPWPDTVRGLHRLRSQYLITTLSNGNVSLLTNMAKNAGMPWDCILSSELAGPLQA